MPVSICPRCKHVNPEYAIYCYFDGVVLQAQQSAAIHRLPSEFVFPSGRRCNTFDELAQGCQEEWAAARDLLIRGVFSQYFRTGQRDDLARAAEDAKAHPNPDIGLTTFLTALPGTRTQTPKLDLNPRRILLGPMLVGETKTVPLTITNQGQSVLQGTVSIAEGQDWLSLSTTGPKHEVDVVAVREQIVPLTIHAKGIAAAQSYGAKLTVVTNGGIVEVPLRMELVALPFPKAPFQGARTQRELADKMRQHPKAAVPILETGEVQRWYALNGWTYPVSGPPVKGVAGVQQFFEGMGVSKPPPVTLSKNEIRFTCKYRETVQGEVTLQTGVKKWVYAQVTTDATWLKPLQTQVAGPQHTPVAFAIDTNLLGQASVGEGRLTVEANGGQKLILKVIVEVQGIPSPTKPPPTREEPRPPRPASMPAEIVQSVPAAPTAPAGSMKFIPAFLTTLLLCLALRILLIPIADLTLRHDVAVSAAQKLNVVTAPGSPITEVGGWLRLPWLGILAGSDQNLPVQVFQPDSNAGVAMLDFRHYYISYFIRWFVLGTFWIGGIVGAILVVRRGGTTLDIPWGVVAGAIAGFGVSATLAACFLAAEMLPHTLWHLAVGAHGGVGYLTLWIVLAVLSWFVVGIVLGVLLPWIGPLRRLLIEPFQRLIAAFFRVLGMRNLADYWAPT